MNFTPTGDRMLIESLEVEEKTAGGIYTPPTQEQAKPTQGTIIALGSDKNKLFKLNDKVVYIKSYGIEIENKTYVVVNNEDILGIIR